MTDYDNLLFSTHTIDVHQDQLLAASDDQDGLGESLGFNDITGWVSRKNASPRPDNKLNYRERFAKTMFRR